MPVHHQYFGSPVTSFLFKHTLGIPTGDIHCGMRGLTRDALLKIDLQSQSWEYASEMVLKAARLRLKTAEVPVKFYKDRAGRVSHHRRMGWISPWLAGWINLKVMLVYTPDSFLLKPGLALMALGILLATLLSFGTFSIGFITFNLYWMLFAVTCATLGYSCIQIGVLSCLLHRLRPKVTQKVARIFSYDWGMGIAGVLTLLGTILVGNLVWQYIQHGLRLSEISRPAIMGILLIIIGFQTFCFTLLIEMLNRVAKLKPL
jgi:hypothetical protein